MATTPRVPPPRRPRPDVLALVGQILWDLRKQMMAAEKLEENLSGLFYGICDAVGIEPRAKMGRVNLERAAQPAKPAAPRPVVWLALARTARRDDGSLLVVVKGREPFLLKPHLGALFLALAEDTGSSTDEGVSFKTLDDLSRRVSKHTERPCLSAATVNKYVARLRKELVRRGIDGRVIQVSRRLGRRLALRKAPFRWSGSPPDGGIV
jgi:hypothetical protein